MAEDNVVSIVRRRNECLETFKMRENLVNGLLHERDGSINGILDKNCKHLSNGHDIMPKKLNGFYNHSKINSTGDSIRAPSLRSSPVRKKVMSQNNSDIIKTEEKGENSLLEDVAKKEGDLPCKWMGCHFVATQITELASHAQEQHIEPVKCSDVFVCLWQGCKVYNRPSCSMTWFTKHLESHIGVKPFKCVIDGCSMSFSSQTGLARHVPCHFEDSVRPIKRTTTTGKEESPNKKHLKRKRLKYIRYKKANCHGKTEDFVDQHAVDSIKTRLSDMIVTDEERIGIDGPRIHFKSEVWGKRRNKEKSEVLLHWIPEAILPDEWVPSSEVKKYYLRRSVSIRSLPNHVKADLHPSFYRRLSHRKERRK